MEELSRIIEYTNVKGTASTGDIRRLCKQAVINKYRAVCVNSGFIHICYEELRNNPEILIVTTAGFPLGSGSRKAKIYEGIFAAEEGAKEIDFVMSVGLLKERKDKEVRDEIKNLVMNTRGLADIKVIIEAPILTEEEIARASAIVAEAGAAFIKTATGFNGDTTVDMVKLIRKTVGAQIKIKAAGGIRDLDTVKAMLNAGADTIGTSTLIKFDE